MSTREDLAPSTTTDGTPRRRADTGDASDFLPVWAVYLASTGLTAISLTVIMRLWRATWSAPFYFSGDAVASASHFRTTMDTGWYEFTDKLGAPYGQHYHDFPFSDDLHPAFAPFIGLFTDQVGVAFNAYYVLGFLLTALTTTWFLRRCGLSQAMTITLAVLYALAPYHFTRNESHLFLASYYCVPLAMAVVVQATSGKPLWGRRAGGGKIRSVLTGPGSVTTVCLVLVTLSAAYYAVFAGILLAAAGILAFVRRRDIRRLAGVLAAGAVLVGTLALALLPDLLYSRANGSVAGAFVRNPGDSELYALKFAALVLPAPSHRIPAFAEVSDRYASTFPLPSEQAAIGLVAAIGFIALLIVIPLMTFANRSSRSAVGEQLRELSFLTWVAFLSASVGGLGTLLALFVTDNIRGWNRMSIFIALLALTAVGLLVDMLVRRLRVSVPLLGRISAAAVSIVAATMVLLIGLADQSLKIAVPAYKQTAAEWDSGETFVRDLSDRVPDRAMIFQLPVMVFPESGGYNGVPESDGLKLYLHNSDLRWSGGGIKGRPQSDWPSTVAAQDAQTMARNLAAIGFEGIVIDRAALADAGAAFEAQLGPLLGGPAVTSPDSRYVYYSLQPVIQQMQASTTSAERAQIAAQITGITAGR